MTAEIELEMLRHAVTELTDEVGYNFCHGCYNWGKSTEYPTIKCSSCNSFACDKCDSIQQLSYSDQTTNVCDECYKSYGTGKFFIVTLTDQIKAAPLEWDQLEVYFKDFSETLYYMINVVNDYFELGEYGNYSIELVGYWKGPNGEVMVGLEFFSEDSTEETTIGELVEDLRSYLYEAINGFKFLADSEYLNSENVQDKLIIDWIL